MQNSNASRPGERGAKVSDREGALQVVTLELGEETFAVETNRVHEVLDVIPMTRVPNADPFVPGLINVRGRVVPLIDLRLKFGQPPAVVTEDSRVIVIEVKTKEESLVVGTIADKVHEVTEVASASMEETPQLGMRWHPGFIRAIGKRDDGFLIIVDIDRLFAASGPLFRDAGTRARSEKADKS